MRPELSIIIVSWNGEELLSPCLNSVLKEAQVCEREIIVVDNGSKDGTIALVKKHFPGVILKENRENLGFARANNQGIKRARGEYILLLNQDIVLGKGSLKQMLNFIKADRTGKVAAVAPRLFYPDGRPQFSLRPLPTPLNVLWDLLTFGSFHRNYYDHSKTQEVDQPMAACFLVKAAVLKELGGFDTHPKFFLYFNDVDLSARIKRRGLKQVYLAEAKVIHHHGESALKWRELRRIRVWSEGLYYFLLKQYDKKRTILKILLALEVFFVFCLRFLASLFKIPASSIRAKR